MVDRERLLVRVSELDGYLSELRLLVPERFEEYLRPERRRACERLLQISIETVIAVCHLLVRGKDLGLPAEEDDLFTLLEKGGVLTAETCVVVRRMKAFRNILVHEYGDVDDRLVFEFLQSRLGDFVAFRQAAVKAAGDPTT